MQNSQQSTLETHSEDLYELLHDAPDNHNNQPVPKSTQLQKFTTLQKNLTKKLLAMMKNNPF